MGESGSEKGQIFFHDRLIGVGRAMQQLIESGTRRMVQSMRLAASIRAEDGRWLKMQRLVAELLATPRPPRFWLIDPYFDEPEL